MQSVVKEVMDVFINGIHTEYCSAGWAWSKNLPLSKQTLCMHAYQGSMHPHPVSELKWGLGSQARILEFVGSQQTLLSSEGLRTKKETKREGEEKGGGGGRKQGRKKERKRKEKHREREGKEKHRGIMSKGNSRQQMEALKWTTHSVRLRSGYPIFCARKKRLHSL